ncbi:MAG: hypothetical protein MUF02_05110 [Acidobacteria bacterium]|jgi:hypothetical protein|nr:hypothetical protein [Acidobacteriota bacterium]
MSKISYNLAADRRIDRWAFAWRAGALALASLLLAGLAAANLARQRQIDRGQGGQASLQAERSDRLRAAGIRLQEEIDSWKKAWSAQLAAANRLIERKRFSFISRLDLLERAFHPGLRLQHLSMANEASGRVTMTVSAQTLNDLFSLYRELVPYNLTISNETQAQGAYQVNLSFLISNEKL